MKRLFIYHKIILVLTVLLIATSCEKTLDINENPNNPPIENATPEVLFPSGVMSTAGRVGGDLAIVGGIWSQYWTQSTTASQYRTIDSYNLTNTSSFVTGPYQELFSGALADYQLAITQAEDSQDWRYYLMNKVMKAYTYEVLVDLYDQVPYTEALQGGSNLQPKFDDGYTVYKGLLAEIDDALSKDFRNESYNNPDQIKTDFVFGDSEDFAAEMDNWEKFANTLKLKMYLRMVYAKPADAEAGIRELYQNNAQFLDVNAGVNNFEDTPNSSNPFYEYNVRRLNISSNLRASRTMVTWLQENNDPRIIPYYGTESPTALNQGDYTLSDGVAYTIFRPKATDPVWFISAAESYFLQAEALERYFGGAGAQTMYENGVRAAFEERGLEPEALIEPGGAYAYPATGDFETKLEAIITQKWASCYGSHALEAFFEQNRTGYPRTSAVYSTDPSYVPGQLVYGPNGVTGQGNFPRRLVFPDVEKTRNSNTPEEVPLTTPVWWDTK